MHGAQCGKFELSCIVAATCWHLAAAPPVCTTSPIQRWMWWACHDRSSHGTCNTHGAPACCATCNAIAMQRSLAEHCGVRVYAHLLAVLAVVQPPHWRIKVMHATRALIRDGCHACAALICSALLLHALHVQGSCHRSGFNDCATQQTSLYSCLVGTHATRCCLWGGAQRPTPLQVRRLTRTTSSSLVTCANLRQAPRCAFAFSRMCQPFPYRYHA
jgi:hypothetical protein